MKNIYVDVTILLKSNFVTGIQRVTIEVLTRLLQQKDQYELVLLSEKNANSFYKVDLDLFIAKYAQKQSVDQSLITEELITLDDMTYHSAIFFDIDAAWNCTYSRIDLYPRLKKRNIKVVTLIYDLIVISHPQYTGEGNIVSFPTYVTAVAKYSDIIILNTQDAADQLAYYAREGGIDRELDCRVIPLGADFADTTVDNAAVSKRAKKIAKGKPYILMVSTIEPRKNHKVLLDAFDEGLSALGLQLVFVGRRGWNVDELMDRIAKHSKYKTTLHHLEGENDETVRFLYQNAFMVFFPTYIEGYGLATIEAMQQHTPVALSDIPVMHEVGGEFCDYFNPDAPQEIINIVKKYLTDPKVYQEKREMLNRYTPFTWDQMAEKTKSVLLEEKGELVGDIYVHQMVMLTARADDFLNTVPYIENRMHFIQEIVIFCPEWTKVEIMRGYHGSLTLKYVTDDELLEGRHLPDDHGERNFFLRTLIVRHEFVDDYFIMSDDDYRPLEDISEDFFINKGKMSAFYFYDLDLWEERVFLGTSFDQLQVSTNVFLKAHGYPNLQYASHMPQIICKRWFIEMLDRHSNPPLSGVCEWSAYFNYAVKEYPSAMHVRPYETLSWPGAVTDWDMMVVPQKYSFENHYSILYQDDMIFSVYNPGYGAGADDQSRAIVAVWDKYVEEYRRGASAFTEYAEEYRNQYGTMPQIIFSIQKYVPLYTAPRFINALPGAVIRFSFIVKEDFNQYGELGMRLRFGWSYNNKTNVVECVPDAVGKIVLTIPIPNKQKVDRICLFFAINDGPFECLKEVPLHQLDLE